MWDTNIHSSLFKWCLKNVIARTDQSAQERTVVTGSTQCECCHEWMIGLTLSYVIFFSQMKKIFPMQCMYPNSSWYKISTVYLSVVFSSVIYQAYRPAYGENDYNTLIIFKHCLFLKVWNQRKIEKNNKIWHLFKTRTLIKASSYDYS